MEWMRVIKQSKNMGWASVDRHTRWLSHLQHPVLYLSSLQKIGLSHIWTCYSVRSALSFAPSQCLHNFMILDQTEIWSIVTHVILEKHISPLSSMNSGLEAFSRNSTRGSFSALTFRSTELPITWINGSSRTGLNYCRGDHFISRVKLTCLTTV